MAISTHRSAKYNVTIARLFKLIIAMSQREQQDLLDTLLSRRQTGSSAKVAPPVKAEPDGPPQAGADRIKTAARVKKSTLEERADKRKSCLLAVDCASGNRVVTDFVADISSGGMFIRTSETYAIGQELVLAFAFFRDQRPLKVAGTVARQTGDGVGVKFNRLTPYQRNVLKATVSRLKARKS